MAEQHMDALTLAQELRLERADIRQELKGLSSDDALRRAADLLEEPPGCLRTMRAYDLLVACRRVGDSRAGAWFLDARVNPFHRVGDGQLRHGDLTPRERARLAAVLREAAIPTKQARHARRRSARRMAA